MSYKTLLAGVFTGCLISTQLFANSFGVPERPTHTSPTNGESDLDTTPLLVSSEYQVLDDSSNQIDTATLIESEWLVYIENGVTLVGGTNLTGSDRDQGDTIIFDISDVMLNLSGSSVNYALINHKRLELQDSSNGLLGYVELPDFFWHADNIDTYKAARFKKFNNAVVVEWYYGDSSATSPWEMKIQARLADNELGLIFYSFDFDSDFANNYGNNIVSFCDEVNCYGYTLLSIYNSGNAAVCDLPLLSSDCNTATIYSGTPLDNLAIDRVDHGFASSNSYFPMGLMEGTTYTWVVRHKGTIDGSTQIAGGWSNATTFSTGMSEASSVSADDLTMTLHEPEIILEEMAFDYVIDITNTADEELTDLEVTVTINGDIASVPSECTLISFDSYECSVDSIGANTEKRLTFSMSGGSNGDQVYIRTRAYHSPSNTYTPEISGNTIFVQSLDELTDYEITTTLPSETGKSSDLAGITVSFENISQYSGKNTIFKINLRGGLVDLTSVPNQHCTSISEEFETNIICSFSEVLPNEVNTATFNLSIPKNHGNAVLTVSVCELDECNGDHVTEIFNIDNTASHEEESGEGGGSLWLSPLLGLLLLRRKTTRH